MEVHHHHPVQPCAEVQLDTVLLTPLQAAERLSISRSRLYTLLESGELRCLKIGRSTRIPLRSIHDFVRSLHDESTAGAHPRVTLPVEEV